MTRATTTRSRRLAAIDVGSNSIRLIVAETTDSGSYRVIDDEKEIARLGHGLEETGALDPANIERSADAIARMKDIASGYGVERIRAIATAAVREATNGQTLIDLVRQRAGLDLVIISAEEEARLAHQSVANAFDLRDMTCAVVDIGGGSTEIVTSVDGVIGNVFTLPLGAVRLTERFGACDDPQGRQYMAMRRYVSEQLRDRLPRIEPTPTLIFGSGGTFTTLASVSMHRSTAAGADMLPFTVGGHEMQRDEVRHTLDWLRKMPLAERTSVAGLSVDRADIIVAGILIIDKVMKRFGLNRLRVHDRGIRDGLLLSMVEEIGLGRRPSDGAQVDRLRAARRFAASCRYEERHSEQVARLAVRLFDDLAGASGETVTDETDWRSPINRELLEAAAVLHDVGYLINYSRHHKHSYHLIAHSDMPGYTNRQREIVANVARYHRRSHPKQKHTAYARLSREDQAIVRRLSALLRVADGLDRTHTQSVREVRAEVIGPRVVFRVTAQDGAEVNIWGAERKADLFEEVFGLETRFESSLARRDDANGRVPGPAARSPGPGRNGARNA
jgi:exopolyphosphatase/guanosine-5'-triphosphate,3'-diphosphate pyrophosphatase